MDIYEKIKKRTYIIAEMSGNHAGKLDNAKKIIHAAKEAGADCVKIQTYTPDTITMNCDNEYFRLQGGAWGGQNLYQLYGQAYTPWNWQPELKAEAKKVGIDFFSTPFDKTAVDFLEDMEVEFYKIASFELIDIPLIKYVASKGKPIIMSTGMATLEEIEEAVDTIKQFGNQLILLKCSSAYPAIPKDMNLAVMQDMKNRFSVPTGLSDHSMGSIAAVTAVAMGASVIEKHFCISREISNPDAHFSMEAEEFAQMVRDIRQAERAYGEVIYGPKETEASNLIIRKSVFVSADIKKGEKITEDNIRVIRPGYGLKPKYYEQVLGKTAVCDLERGTPLQFSHLE